MRKEFSAKTKLMAFERCHGRCEGDKCGVVLRPGRWHADHIIPAEFDGPNTVENCQCLCTDCHKIKTGKQDVPAIAKSNRLRRRAAGIRKPRTIRAWRRFDGSVVTK